MCVCMYMCMYVCMYVCMCACQNLYPVCLQSRGFMKFYVQSGRQVLNYNSSTYNNCINTISQCISPYIGPGLYLGASLQQEICHLAVTVHSRYDERSGPTLSETKRTTRYGYQTRSVLVEQTFMKNTNHHHDVYICTILNVRMRFQR